MDLIPITKVNDNQENDLLLNAIKNKFAAKSSNEVAAFSPPKFNIPCLKISDNAKNSVTTSIASVKEITSFVLPQLKCDTKTSAKFELPGLISSCQANIQNLTSSITKLQLEERPQNIPHINLPTTSAIDLTTALASKLYHKGTPPTRDFLNKSQSLQNIEDFDIPFIDCDRQDGSRNYIVLATANEYCITDISQLPLRPNNAEPSVIGQFLNFDNKYKAPLPLKCFSTEFQKQNVKHTIVPFQFVSKSPDDIVLEALSKNHRRYYN